MGIVHKSCMSSQSPVNLFVQNQNCIKLTLSGCPREFSHRDTCMYIAPSSGHTSFNFNMPFKLILRRLFSNVWSENTALFERLMEIHSNSPKLYYGFNFKPCYNFNKL